MIEDFFAATTVRTIAITSVNIAGIIISIFVPILSAKIIVDLTSSKFKQVIFISIVILFVELSRNIVNFFARKFSQIIYRETFVEIQTKLGSEILLS